MKATVKFVSYDISLREIVNLLTLIEFRNGLNCGAAFYQTLANLADWVRLVGGTSDSLKSYMHHQEIQNTARALSLVRQMLLDPKEQLSQGVISAGKLPRTSCFHPCHPCVTSTFTNDPSVTHLITYSVSTMFLFTEDFSNHDIDHE